MPFYATEAIIVPSRARGKHGEISRKRRVFSQLDRHYVYQFCSPTRCAIQTVRAHAHAAAPEGREENTHTRTVCFVHRVLVVMTICQDRLRTPHTKRVFVDNNASPLFVRLFDCSSFVLCCFVSRFLLAGSKPAAGQPAKPRAKRRKPRRRR